jgi:putative methyltransferase (TIGR04325 family)
VGYDNPEPAQMYRGEYLERVFPRDYPLLFWLRRLLASGARDVFDFGGHVGTKFYAYRRYLEHPTGLRWTVYDVPAVRQAGAELAARRGDAHALRFVESPAAATGCDVYLAIGSLQYVEASLGALLRALPQPPAHVLVNEFTAYPGRSVVTLQSVGTAFCPYKFVNRDAFVQDVQAAGYELADAWSNPEKACRVPFEAGLVIDAQQGFYFRRAER